MGDKSRTGAMVTVLEADMLTVREAPKFIVPGSAYSEGTEYEGHAFFEASSIRKKDSRYYFIYSSQVMQAIPTVVQIGDKTYEGIHLYINKMTYCIPLTYEEIDIIFGILKDFSFTTETTKVLVAYDSIIRRGEISTQEQMQLNKKTPFD